MRLVPQPIKQRMWGRGALTTLPALAAMAFIGVWQIGWWGVLVLCIALLVGLAAELWREAVVNEVSLESAAKKLQDNETTRATAERERDEATREAAELRRIVSDLDGQLVNLRSEVEAPTFGVGQVIHGLGSHVEQIGLLRRHRRLEKTLGSDEWPVTQIKRGDAYLTIVAHVGDGAKDLAGEPICLMDNIGRRIATSLVRDTTATSIEVRVETAGLPSLLRRRVANVRTRLDPDRFRVRLSGSTEAGALRALSDDELDQLEKLLDRTSQALTRVLVPKGEEKARIEEAS